MSFYRQLLVITVPSVAVLLGIYWYRRRRGFGTCDPGGSVRKVLKQELEEALEAKTLENNKIVTPTKLIVKSAPIDIVPNGINSQRSSPIELTDKELDLEIEKVKAQRLYDMDTTVKKCSKENTPPLQNKRAKSLPTKSATPPNTTSAETPEKKTSFSVKQDSPISCLTEQLLNSKQNRDSSERLQSDDIVTMQIKNEIKEEAKPEAEVIKTVEAVERPAPKTPVSDNCELQSKVESKKSNNDKCTNSTKSDKAVKSKKSRKQLNLDKKSKEDKKSPKDSSEKQQQCVILENSHNNLDLNNKNDINVDVINDQDSKQAIESNNQNTSLSEIDMPQNRDSANHSPCDTMLASPSLGHFSDNHSEGSNDSGKGCSESPSPPPTNASQTSNYIVHQFILPRYATGFLIGARKANLQKFNTVTAAKVSIRDYESETHNICCVEGTQQDVDIVLDMIKQKLMTKRFPYISLKDVSADLMKNELAFSQDYCRLHLVDGVNNDVTISCLVSPSQLFVQQPMHPTFLSLHILHNLMRDCYQDPAVPRLPSAVTLGMICAAPTVNNWYRTQVISTDEENDKSVVKLVDFGGFMDISNSLLKQIRQDFFTMIPFQATEIQLADIIPINGDEWSPEAVQVIAALTVSQILQAQVVGYNEECVPQVYLYLTLAPQQVISLNQELVVRGLAQWIGEES